jgi:hypothetical protein
MFSRTLY